MRRGRSGGGLAALLQTAKAYFTGIQIKSSAYTSIYDESNNEIARIYKDGTGIKIKGDGNAWISLSTEMNLIGGNATLAWDGTYFYPAQSGKALGTSSFPFEYASFSEVLLGRNDYTNPRYMSITHKNNSGSASVLGYRYKVQASTGFVISVPGDTIATLGLLIARQVVADGSFAKSVILGAASDGMLVALYFSTATTAGHYANFDGVNNGQFVDAVAPVANQCAGIIMETIAGAGVALVLIQRQ
jgi:hypothetical protein